MNRLKRVGNVLGYLSGVCRGCGKCKGEEVKWRIVVRLSRSGKRMYGIECDEVGLRLVNL